MLILSHHASVCGHPNFHPHDGRRICVRLSGIGNAALEDVQELLAVRPCGPLFAIWEELKCSKRADHGHHRRAELECVNV